METQKIENLLNNSDNESSSSTFQQENVTVLMTKIMDNMAEKMKMFEPLSLKQKSLNQIFKITQMQSKYSRGRRYKSCRCCCKY